MAMQKIEHDRVKNLLIDTVTLLCKNSLQYRHELCIEGLLGVKVDQKDVFFVHISETFPSNHPPSVEDETGLGGHSGDLSRQNHHRQSSSYNNKGRHRTRVEENHHVTMATDTSGLRPAEIVAGSRRSGHKRQANTSRSQDFNNSEHDHFLDQSGNSDLVEPQNKRPNIKYESLSDDSGAGLDRTLPVSSRSNEIVSNPWPSLASMGQHFGSLVAQVAQNSLESGQDGGHSNETDPTQTGWPLTAGVIPQNAGDVMIVPSDASLATGVSPGKSPRTQKDFPCEVCGKMFHMSHHLRQHMRTHTGERPYRCEVCGVLFTQVSSLHRHQRAQHPHVAKSVQHPASDSGATSQNNQTTNTATRPSEPTLRMEPTTLRQDQTTLRQGQTSFINLNPEQDTKTMATMAEQSHGLNSPMELVDHTRSDYFPKADEVNKASPPQYLCGDCNLEFDLLTHFEHHVKTFHDNSASQLEKSSPLP